MPATPTSDNAPELNKDLKPREAAGHGVLGRSVMWATQVPPLLPTARHVERLFIMPRERLFISGNERLWAGSRVAAGAHSTHQSQLTFSRFLLATESPLQ